jgi:hypothetical protein
MLIPILAVQGFSQSSRTTSSSSGSGSSDQVGPCVAEAKWSNSDGSLNFPRGSQLPISLTVLTHVSKGPRCADAEVRLTVTYLSDAQEFICAGTIPRALTVSTESQVFNIEIRPFAQNDFVRWRNQPGARGLQMGKPLQCLNLDGTSELADVDRSKATWVHIAMAVLPNGGGLAVLEAWIRVS